MAVDAATPVTATELAVEVDAALPVGLTVSGAEVTLEPMPVREAELVSVLSEADAV